MNKTAVFVHRLAFTINSVHKNNLFVHRILYHSEVGKCSSEGLNKKMGYKTVDETNTGGAKFLFCCLPQSLRILRDRMVRAPSYGLPNPCRLTPAVPRDNFAPPVRLKFYWGKYSPKPLRSLRSDYVSSYVSSYCFLILARGRQRSRPLFIQARLADFGTVMQVLSRSNELHSAVTLARHKNHSFRLDTEYGTRLKVSQDADLLADHLLRSIVFGDS